VSYCYEQAAIKILDWLHRAERELVGKVVATFNGEAGEVYALKLDDHHGLCFTIDNPEHGAPNDGSTGMIKLPQRWYPVSTIRQVAL
jgi:hypothetical protein